MWIFLADHALLNTKQVFNGDMFESDPVHVQLKSILIDVFRGDVVDSISLGMYTHPHTHTHTLLHSSPTLYSYPTRFDVIVTYMVLYLPLFLSKCCTTDY